MQGLSDEQLVSLSVQGDQRAFAELVHRYEQPLSALIRYMVHDSHQAEDIMQDTLVSAWLSLAQLKDPGKVKSWLLQIARNRCHDFYRSADKRGQPIESQELEYLVNRYGRAQGGSERPDQPDIGKAFAGVSELDRTVLRMFYLEGLSIRDIMERHRCPEGTVKRRLHSARNHLRKILGTADQADVEGS